MRPQNSRRGRFSLNGWARLAVVSTHTNFNNNNRINNYHDDGTGGERRFVRQMHSPDFSSISLLSSSSNYVPSTTSLAQFSSTSAVKSNNEIAENATGPIESPMIEPVLMFPLGSEKLEHLHFPSHVLHYSVSPSARFVYVVGQEANNVTRLNVWDLHRGIKRVYKYTRMYHVRHFYALNDTAGLVVSSTTSLEQFVLYCVTINHATQQILTQKHIKNCTSTGHVSFWSSCRYKENGIVFAMIDQRGVYICKYELGKDQREFIIDRDQLNNHYFVGQPFVYGKHVMFLEREYFSLKFTGRVVRIGLDDGRMDNVETSSAPNCTLFANDLMNSSTRMPNRIKHVERDGQLWAIMESSVLSAHSHNGSNRLLRSPQRRKFIGVLCLKDWTWREVSLDINASYDEISLDVTASGTVVIIKRGNCLDSSIVCGFYFLQTRNPKTLMCSSFHRLVNYYEELRFLGRDQLHEIGISDDIM